MIRAVFSYTQQKKYQTLIVAGLLIGLLLGTGYSLFRFDDTPVGQLVINEFVASNGTVLADEDGDFSDWIELYNPTRRPVNLSGWALTDDPQQPEKWPFPNITLGGGEYLIVFASGKNRTNVEQPLHANFKLSKSGEFLGLYHILDQQFVDSIAPIFPNQLRDVAYGRAGSTFGYFKPATPGQPNDSSEVWIDVTDPVTFSVSRGFYDAPFLVDLTTTTPKATIRYTTDGSDPTETNGATYTQPIKISGTTVLRAAAFKENFITSKIQTHSYIFIDEVLEQPPNPPGFPNTWGRHPSDLGGYQVGAPVLADYEMDREVVDDPRYRDLIKEGLLSIPTLSLVTDIHNFDIYANPRERGFEWERPVSVELIDPNSHQPGFQIDAGLRIHGGESRWEYIPKHSFRLLFKGRYGATTLDYPLFPDSPVESFDKLVLRGGVSGYAGKPFTDHKAVTYSRDEWLRESQIAVSGVGSHGIFVHLYLNGLYWGLYNVVERIDEPFLAAYFGGNEINWHIATTGDTGSANTRFDTLIQLVERGDPSDHNTYAQIKNYLDTTQFIDYVLLNWYAGNRDWPGNNWTAVVKDPTGQVRYLVWDGENSWLDDSTQLYLGKADATVESNSVKFLFEALVQNPDFKMELADRTFKHLFNNGALTDANAQARWMEINNEIDLAIIGESARWGDVRFDTPITRDDWLAARDNVLAQMEGRAASLVSRLRTVGYYPKIDPPLFNRQGGLVDADFRLKLTNPQTDGDIYYTLDGSDPRMPATGAVAPGARIYGSPLQLTTSTPFKARLLDGNTWSALNEATFSVVAQDHRLRITEIMYNPTDGGSYEFIELQNLGDADMDVSNMTFDGIDFTFPASTSAVKPGQLVVLVSDADTFAKRYPDVKIGGVYNKRLSNSGEELTLRDVNGKIVTSVNYGDDNGWPVSPDGRGDSLVFVSGQGDPNDPKNWRASLKPNGSPGKANPQLRLAEQQMP